MLLKKIYLEIIPIEKEPLKKQLVDSLYIEEKEIFKKKKEKDKYAYKKQLIQLNKFFPKK